MQSVGRSRRHFGSKQSRCSRFVSSLPRLQVLLWFLTAFRSLDYTAKEDWIAAATAETQRQAQSIARLEGKIGPDGVIGAPEDGAALSLSFFPNAHFVLTRRGLEQLAKRCLRSSKGRYNEVSNLCSSEIRVCVVCVVYCSFAVFFMHLLCSLSHRTDSRAQRQCEGDIPLRRRTKRLCTEALCREEREYYLI